MPQRPGPALIRFSLGVLGAHLVGATRTDVLRAPRRGSADRYPALHPLAADTGTPLASAEAEFMPGMDVVLDGIAAPVSRA